MTDNNNNNSSDSFEQTAYYIQQAKKLLQDDLPSSRLRRFEAPISQLDSFHLARELQKDSSAAGQSQIDYLKNYATNQNGEHQQQIDPVLKKLSRVVADKHQGIQDYARGKYDSGHFQAAAEGVSNKIDASNISHFILLKQLEEIRKRQKQEREKMIQDIVDALRNFEECHHNYIPISDIIRECHRNPGYLDIETSATEWESQPMFGPRVDLKQTNYGDPSRGPRIDKLRPLPNPPEDEWFEHEEPQETEASARFIPKGISDILRKNKFKLAKIIYAQLLEANQYVDVGDTKPTTKKYQYEVPKMTPYRYQKVPMFQPNESTRSSYASLFTLEDVPEYKIIPSVGEPIQAALSQDIFQKVASKRKGNTRQFHPKTFTLRSGDLLSYKGDQDKEQKTLSLSISKMEIAQMDKEKWGFFKNQKKSTTVFKIVCKERIVDVQMDQLEGMDLYNNLVQYMALKAYNQYCVACSVVEWKIGKFIRSEDLEELDLSEYALVSRNHRNTDALVDVGLMNSLLDIWLMLLGSRTKIRKLLLHNSGLNPNTLSLIMDQVRASKLPLTQITIRGNPLNQGALKSYLQLVAANPSVTTIDLSGCRIVEDVFVTCFKDLNPEVISRVTVFNCSQNPKLGFLSGNVFSGLFKSAENIDLYCDGNSFPDSVLLDLLSNDLKIRKLTMNRGDNMLLDDRLVQAISGKLAQNSHLVSLQLMGISVRCEDASLRELIGASSSLEELAMDFGMGFLFGKVNNRNEWFIQNIQMD